MKKAFLFVSVFLFSILSVSGASYATGDVDGKNGVDNRDYALVRNHILKKKLLTGNELKRADVDGRNGIDNRDYVLIRNTIIDNLKQTPTPTPKTIFVSEVKLNKSSITIKKGKTKTLVASISPSNATNKNVTWSSKDTKVATVNSKGVVKGVGVGNTTITVKTKDGNKTATCNVKVGDIKQYTVTFIGGDIISTGFEGNEVLIKGGKVSEHSSYVKYNKSLNLKQNQKYAVSFDYQTKSGNNTFDIDIYPDKINQSYPKGSGTIQVNLEAGSTRKHYDWVFASNDSKIEEKNVALRFFDDIRGSNENDITINNILLSIVKTKTYNGGSTLGNLPNPSRTGYRFLGWYTSSTGGKKVTKTTQVTSDMTLYARWTGKYDHVYIIGIDGLGDTYRPDKQKSEPYNKVDAVNFRRIFGNYAYRYDANSENITISAQNWTSILNGVACETHGITNPIAAEKKRTSSDDNLTVFYYIKKQMPNAKMTSIVNWNPINNGIIESDLNVDKKHPGDDTKVTSSVIKYVKDNKKDMPTIMFVHLCDVDHAAHANVKSKKPNCNNRCGGYSQEYYDQAQVSDTQLGQMFDTLNNLGLLEKSLFITVADHGESAVSHGTKKSSSRDPEEDHVLVAVRGYTVNKMTLPTSVHNRDVSAIVLYALGIDKPEHFISTVPSGLFKE